MTPPSNGAIKIARLTLSDTYPIDSAISLCPTVSTRSVKPTVQTTAADIPCNARPMMRRAMLRPRHNISVAPANASRPERRGIRRDSERSANQPHIAVGRFHVIFLGIKDSGMNGDIGKKKEGQRERRTYGRQQPEQRHKLQAKRKPNIVLQCRLSSAPPPSLLAMCGV